MRMQITQPIAVFGAAAALALAVGFGPTGGPLASDTPSTSPSSSTPSAPAPTSGDPPRDGAPGDTGCIPGMNC